MRRNLAAALLALAMTPGESMHAEIAPRRRRSRGPGLIVDDTIIFGKRRSPVGRSHDAAKRHAKMKVRKRMARLSRRRNRR